MDETSIEQALQQLDTTLAALLQRSQALQARETASGIRCHRYWNPAAKTFTYHTHVVVLRSVPEDVPVLHPSKQVFMLPPTGDIFALDDAGLHWHHICTTSGVRLLPGVLDRWLMNLLRATGLDRKQRETYIAEAEAFTRFVATLQRYCALATHSTMSRVIYTEYVCGGTWVQPVIRRTYPAVL